MNRFRAAVFLIIACLYLAVPNARPDFTRFNCNDSESYLSLAWNLAHGGGYTRSLVEDLYIPHTTWPPGTPLLMVPATALPGRVVNWYAVKWTMCCVGLSGMAMSWWYLRRVTGNVRVADLGASFVAMNPLYWDFSHQAMAEIPLTVWLIGGLLLVDCVWAHRKVRWHEALAAGAVCGFAMLFKGHGGGLVFAPLGYLWGARRASSSAFMTSIMGLVFAIGFSVPQLTWMARNRTVVAEGFDGINRFRSILAVNPNDADSPLVDKSEFVTRVKDNFRQYAIYRLPEQIVPGLWPATVWKWNGSGFLALTISLFLAALAFPRSFSASPPIVAALAMIGLNIAYAFGGAARFWLPISALVILAIFINLGPKLVDLSARRLIVCLFVLLANLVSYITYHENHPYNEGAPWPEFAQLLEAIGREPEISTVGVLTHNPEAFQLMTGLPAPFGKEDVLYDHAIIDARKYKPPADDAVVVARFPWLFIALPKAMTHDDFNLWIPHAAP